MIDTEEIEPIETKHNELCTVLEGCTRLYSFVNLPNL